MHKLKLLTLPLLSGTLFYTACGDKSETSAETPAEAAPAPAKIQIPEEPAAAIQYVIREMAGGNGAVLWEAMPASYQTDVNSIAQLAGTKIDPELYDRVFATVGRLANVLNKQKTFALNSSLGGEEKDPEEIAKMEEAWPSIMQLVETLTSSALVSASGLQNFDGKDFFAGTVSAILADVDALSKLQPESDEPTLAELKNAEVKYVEGTEMEATLEISMPNGESESEVFTQVEGRWVPKEMADEWTAQMAEARTSLEEIDPAQMAQQKPQIMGVFAMIDGVLTQIEAAETQQQFDQALQGAMMPLMGLMMLGQGMGGGSPSPMAPMPTAPAMPEMPSEPIAP